MRNTRLAAHPLRIPCTLVEGAFELLGYALELQQRILVTFPEAGGFGLFSPAPVLCVQASSSNEQVETGAQSHKTC